MTYIHEYRKRDKHNVMLITNIQHKSNILIIKAHYYFR